MIKVFFADDMSGTLLAPAERARTGLTRDIVVSETAETADVIVGRFRYALADYFHLNREYYLYTHEPKFCPVAGRDFIDLATGKRIHVSTAWNGDIYADPFYYFPFSSNAISREELRERVAAKSKSCVMLATYTDRSDRYQGDVNADLGEYRQRIAIELQSNHDFCDIYGKGWRDDVTVAGESRGHGWHEAKLGILADYRFNLAFEHTLIENYVTEKLWDPYLAAAVPIYHGRGSGIGSVLGEGSFIDYSAIGSVSELFELLSSMSVDDCLEILESGHSDIAKVRERLSRRQVVEEVIDRFADRVREI